MEAFELEIEWNWWTWRGFRPYDRIEHEFIDCPECESFWQLLCDPMDLGRFEEEDAFPLLKPSIHVFGFPRLSRTQRGWHQVLPPSGKRENSCQDCPGLP